MRTRAPTRMTSPDRCLVVGVNRSPDRIKRDGTGQKAPVRTGCARSLGHPAGKLGGAVAGTADAGPGLRFCSHPEKTNALKKIDTKTKPKKTNLTQQA